MIGEPFVKTSRSACAAASVLALRLEAPLSVGRHVASG